MNVITFLLFTSVMVVGSAFAQDDHSDHKQHSEPEQTISISKVQLDNLDIEIGPLTTNQKIPLLKAPGKIVIPPANEYIVSTPQSGLINKLYVSIGDTVSKDQVLATINSPDLLALQRQYLKASSNQQVAYTTMQRDRKLLDQSVISERRWQQTKSQYLSAVAEANETRQLLEISSMSDQAIKTLKKTRHLTSALSILSPINGVILERMSTTGKRIDNLEPLYHIANLDQLWLEINIPHERITQISLGDRVLIENSTATARISLVGQNVDPVNQTILARAVIESTKAVDIRAGQMVNTQVVQASNHPTYSVTNTAIARSQGQAYIFIRSETGFIIEAVDILGKDGKNSTITGDLQGNENIAIRGAVALKAKWMELGSTESKGHNH